MNKRGRKSLEVVLLVFAIIVIFSMYFALSSSGNTKVYDSGTKTVSIKNGENEIANIRLNTPLVYNVIRGEDRLVAEFTIENFNSYSNAFGEMEFYDTKNSMKKLNRDFSYKYKIVENIEVADYETVCEDRTAENGSIEKYNCHENYTGTHNEQRIRWNNFNENVDLPEGEITIGIFTDVFPNERIEWIPNLFGVKIDDWAVWTESLNIDIKAYYTLNETGAGTGVINAVDPLGIYNASTDLASANKGSTIAKYGTSYNFTDGNKAIFLPNNLLNKTRANFTMVMWIYPNSDLSDRQYIVTYDNAGAYNQTVFRHFDVGMQSWADDVQGRQWTCNTNVFLTAGKWYMFAWQYTTDGTGQMRMFLNNTNICEDNLVNMTLFQDKDYFIIGKTQSEGWNGFKGYIDEVGIWDRYLNQSEIEQLYNEGVGISYSPDVLAPNTTIPTITPSSPKSNEDLKCNATLTDNFQASLTAYWKWYKNDALILSGTKTGISNGTNTLITTLDSGNTTRGENWICEIIPNDGINNGIAKNSSIATILNSPPDAPNQLLPANGSGYAMGSTVFFIWNNSIDSDGDNLSYKLEIYNESDMAAAHLIHSISNITQGTTNTSVNVKISNYILKDDDYYWRVRGNDTEDGGWSSIKTFQYANWTITFNLTDSYSNEQINTGTPQLNFDISCNNSFIVTDVENPYTALDKFAPGMWECTFSDFYLSKYFDKTQNITVNGDKTIEISMSQATQLTSEEHTWLEAIYECIVNKNCDLYNLLLEINNTVGNVWEHTKPTDNNVVISESMINKEVNSTNNLTINYTISIPLKAGYSIGTYLPIRIGFWFLNMTNTTCYNQGEQPAGVKSPYCQPLIIETIGPMGGEVNFTVELGPSLPSGDYSIKRIIDIDPNNVWINYGQEVIGTFRVTESLTSLGASVKNTGEVMPKTTISKITGAFLGASQRLLSGWQIVIIISILGLMFIIFTICRTIINLKKK